MAGSGANSSRPPGGGAGQGDLFGAEPVSEPVPRPGPGRASDAAGGPAAAAARRRSTPATGERAEVGAPPHDPSLAALAARLPATLRFGTSSWGFAGWAGLVYDRPHRESQLSRDGLAAYSRHPLLRAVGVDRGFYAPVPPADLERYAAAVPDDFRFLLKAHAALTTVPGGTPPAFLANTPPAFLDVEHACRAVVEPAARAWGSRLGAILFQFSPLGARVLRHRARLLERLHGFLAALPRGLPYAVEWRDREMLGPDYDALLADVGAVHGAAAHPRLPPVDQQLATVPRATAGPLVLRWLLHPGESYEGARGRFAPFDRLQASDAAARGAIATVVAEALQSGREALVIVNNKAEGSAPLSVVELARQMGREGGAAC
jgi:uncharacterized protein YecE (DUF72 family)